MRRLILALAVTAATASAALPPQAASFDFRAAQVKLDEAAEALGLSKVFVEKR